MSPKRKVPNTSTLTLAIARSSKTFAKMLPDFYVEDCIVQDCMRTGGVEFKFRISNAEGDYSSRRVVFTPEGELKFSWSKTGISNQEEVFSTIYMVLMAFTNWYTSPEGVTAIVNRVTFPLRENVRLEASHYVGKDEDGNDEWNLAFGVR